MILPVNGGFLLQKASNTEIMFMPWYQYGAIIWATHLKKKT